MTQASIGKKETGMWILKQSVEKVGHLIFRAGRDVEKDQNRD
jgi:hypothetical protein